MKKATGEGGCVLKVINAAYVAESSTTKDKTMTDMTSNLAYRYQWTMKQGPGSWSAEQYNINGAGGVVRGTQ